MLITLYQRQKIKTKKIKNRKPPTNFKMPQNAREGT
jgi:hypothetical protein